MAWRRARSLGVAVTVVATLAIPAQAIGAAPPSAPGAGPRASVTLYLPDAFFVHRDAVTVPGRRFHITGVVRPYVADQWVNVTAALGRHVIRLAKLRLAPSRNHSYGQFSLGLASPGSGTLVISVGHAQTPQLQSFRASRSLAVLSEQIGFGSTGRFVQLIQQRLAALHFYIPQTGVFDQGTTLALDAYHRLLRWGTSEAMDGRTISFLMDGFGTFKVRFPRHGRHAEGNLSLQLLALVDGSSVEAIYPISSGKPSTPTIVGDFHVYSKVPGYLPDGMYYSNFFYTGYAIHGYDPAPDYPASHGCMRLPIVDATSVYGWLGIGDWVDVYY
jgi:L,D-transpeptidase catalytic domain